MPGRSRSGTHPASSKKDPEPSDPLEKRPIEAAAQAALVLYALNDDSRGDGIKFIGKVKSEFQDLPMINEQITIHVMLDKMMKNLGIFSSTITVGERPIGSLNLICGVMAHAK